MATCLWRYWCPTQNYLSNIIGTRLQALVISQVQDPNLLPWQAATPACPSSQHQCHKQHQGTKDDTFRMSPLPLCLPAATAAWQATETLHCQLFRAQPLSQQEEIHSLDWRAPGTMHSGGQMAQVLLNKAMWDQSGSLTGTQMCVSKSWDLCLAVFPCLTQAITHTWPAIDFANIYAT